MSSDGEEEQLDALGLFQEPEDFYPPPKPPTKQLYTLKSGQDVVINLVGWNNLEGHYLWNGSRFVSRYFEEHIAEIKDRTVLEIGAGGGLPSLVCAHLGARKAVCTDYPDRDLIVNIQKNIDENAALIAPPVGERIVGDGYAWGRDPSTILAHLPDPEQKFDVLILADLLFKHMMHEKMLKTVADTLSKKKKSTAFVFFTSYRPWLREKDMGFFELAREKGFLVEKVFEVHMEKPMFDNDPGDLEVQKLCTGWTLKWPEGMCSEESVGSPPCSR